ncbi:MAG: motility protein A [Spirochaetaceae bacterium]|nr:MAG: motility protein A [Spirochaetaceae bacterium]
MDLATIVGLLVGFAALVVGIFWTGGSPLGFFSPASIFITVVGSFCALMVANPLSRVLGIMRYFRLTMRVPVYEEERIISQLVTFSEKARREGLLALEDDLEEVEDEFLRKGIQLVVDGTDPDIIKNILYNELNQIQSRHAIGIGIFDDWSKLAPAFGMIGTLIGLIIMLAQIEDKSAIGFGMSTALITTLYGAVLGYLVFLPVKRKLEDRDNSESLVKEIMIEGILSIQSGDNPRILEEKLLAFLAPLRREAVRQEAVRE